tara:strand:- start:101 stop:487 length:387 start_codon:yes stop_codon:yes gene_type:complete
MNNLDIFQENINSIENIKFFTNENKLIFDVILSKLKSGEKPALNNLKIDKQLVDRIFKFASIKHILNNHKNDQQKIFELLDEYLHDFKIHGLEIRIEELESKFSKDLSETTFNEIKNLKEQKKKQNIN